MSRKRKVKLPSRLFIEGDERTYDGLIEFAGAFGKDSFHALFGGDGK